MADVFISYARTDRNRVEKLAGAIEAQGLSVWWDRNIVGGAEFSKDIERELNAAKAVIVAWSAAGNESAWVKDEATAARDQGKFVPVSLDGASAPMGFRQYQAINLAGWDGDTQAFAFTELGRAVKARVSGEIPPASVASRHATPRLPARPLLLAISAVVSMAALAAIVLLPRLADFPDKMRAAKVAGPADAAIDSASIAVLPFADLSPQHDQQYFSDGIAEEILNVLARIEGLKVASRTSSFQFRNPQAGVPAIARDLGVRHILEGSVRKAGSTIRITAQLIDAGSDRHLWSETYDRPLTAENIFAIQDEIANAIVRELAGRIGIGAAPSGAVDVAADTQSVEAYELYLKGRSLFVARGTENLREAVRALEKATALDPEFARAWETLAMAYGVSESWGLTDRDYNRLALDAADRAERLNPKLSTPYAVRGSVIYDMIGTGESDDWEASLSNLDEAIRRDPKNATAWFWRGYDFLALGYFDRAIADIEKCLQLDPGYNYCARWLAFAHLVAGREEKALVLYERSKKSGTSSEAAFAAVYVARGDRSSARAILADFYEDVPQLASALYRALTDPSFSDADRTAALALIDKEPPPAGSTAARFFLGDYSDVANNINSGLWWYPGDKRYLKSAERKAHMRAFHLPDYWRAHGFPPQCRPVGADDFECD
jgi:TolB-like protein/Flp pilus assembly protein TadD